MTDDNMPDVQPDKTLQKIMGIVAMSNWNAAIEAAAELVDNSSEFDTVYGDEIRKLKK